MSEDISQDTLITERTLPPLPPIGHRYIQLAKDIQDIHDAARDADDFSVYVDWLKQVFQSWDYGEVIEHMWLVFADVRQEKGVNELYVDENKNLRKEKEDFMETVGALRLEVDGLKKDGEENKKLRKENGELVDIVAALREEVEGLKKGAKDLKKK
ncbi:Cytoplasmic 60S subunit biogenesis factor [Venturia nashicola]|nr:Cytoplasmic 60S subunit biogenesis factor [Venturia nashicola]